MDERVAQFQSAAEARGVPADRLAKEIATLRKFLFRNQEHRFTERERAKLMTAISAHWANPACHATMTATGEQLIFGLLDDALKMPFSVFSTANKQQMLKWFFSLQEKGEGKAPAVCALVVLPCIDVSPEGYATLLLEDGGTREDVLVPEDQRASLAASLGKGDDVSVAFDAATRAFARWEAAAP